MYHRGRYEEAPSVYNTPIYHVKDAAVAWTQTEAAHQGIPGCKWGQKLKNRFTKKAQHWKSLRNNVAQEARLKKLSPEIERKKNQAEIAEKTTRAHLWKGVSKKVIEAIEDLKISTLNYASGNKVDGKRLAGRANKAMRIISSLEGRIRSWIEEENKWSADHPGEGLLERKKVPRTTLPTSF